MIIKLPSAKQGFLGLDRVVRRLIAEDGFSDSQAALRAIANYEKFFILIATHQTEPLTPSQQVDLVWQRHILDTKAYIQDCIRWAGSYIHRYQGSSSSSFESISMRGIDGNCFNFINYLAGHHFYLNLPLTAASLINKIRIF